MYIAFTEEQAQEIRSHGISVIRFKWLIKNSISIIQWYGMQLGKAIQQFADVLSDVFNEMQSVLDKTADITRCKKQIQIREASKQVRVLQSPNSDSDTAYMACEK